MLSISLAIFPVCAIVAFAIAIAGQKRDFRGALIAALAMWLISSFFLYLASHQLRSWWIQYIAALIMTSASMLMIVLPMLAVRGSDWVRGRLAAGLGGSVVAALVFPGVVLTTGCWILGDCS